MGSSKSVQAEAPNPTVTAQQTLAAQQATDPASQQLAYKLASGPGGVQDYTQLGYDTRSSVFTQEEAVKNALLQSLLQGYNSPYSIPDQMQSGVNQVRQNAQNKLQESMRTRANLGGGLYGGRSAQSEAQSVSDLNAGFAEQDYNQMNQNRQIQLNATLQALQQLYPQLSLSSAPFQSAAPTSNEVYSGQMAANQSAANAANQNAANKNAMVMRLIQTVAPTLSDYGSGASGGGAQPYSGSSLSYGNQNSFTNTGSGYGATQYAKPTGSQLTAILGK